MSYTKPTHKLTHQGAMAMLSAAASCAEEIGQPQCIVIVDASGELVAELRMTGAKFLSRKSALAKALTAASSGVPGTAIPEDFRLPIGLASGGSVSGLPGGLPIKVDGDLIGGIGIGSGTGDQDIAVARAAVSAIGADEVS